MDKELLFRQSMNTFLNFKYYKRLNQRNGSDMEKLNQIYSSVLKKEAELIKEIGNGDPTVMQIFSIFYYLCWNGYLSAGGSFEFSDSHKGLTQFSGSSILMGYGVCRHISSKFQEILEILKPDIESTIAGVHLWYDHRLGITDEIGQNLGEVRHFKKNVKVNPSYADVAYSQLKNNHVVNLVKTRNPKVNFAYIAFDPTNFCIFGLNSNIKNNNIHYDCRLPLFFPCKETSGIQTYRDMYNFATEATDKSIQLLNYGTIQFPIETEWRIRQEGINLCMRKKDLLSTYVLDNRGLYRRCAAEIAKTEKKKIFTRT